MFSVDPEAVFMGGVSGSHAGITAKRALRGPTSLDCLFRVNYREHVQAVLRTPYIGGNYRDTTSEVGSVKLPE